MTVKRNLSCSFLLLLLVLGCAPATVNYTGAAVFPPKKAKAVIRETILNQPAGYAPQGVLINDEVLEIRKITSQGRGRHRSTVTDTMTVPLDGIGDIELTRTTIYYVVTIFDKEEREQYRIYTKLETRAKNLIDALKTVISMRTASKTREEVPPPVNP